MEREDGVTQLAGAVDAEIFTARKGHIYLISFILKYIFTMYNRCAGIPTTHGHTKLVIASGENNIHQHQECASSI